MFSNYSIHKNLQEPSDSEGLGWGPEIFYVQVLVAGPDALEHLCSLDKWYLRWAGVLLNLLTSVCTLHILPSDLAS